MDRRSFLKTAAAAAIAPALPAAAAPAATMGIDVGAGDATAVVIICGRLVIDQRSVRVFDRSGCQRVAIGEF